MDILNPKQLREKADYALRRGRDPKKLIYTYAGLSLGISLLVHFITLLLDSQIPETGGLGAFGDRALLATVQQTLPILASFVTMALDFGYLAGMMRIARGQYADHTDLKVGFHRFWPLLRLVLLQGLIYVALVVAAFYLSYLIFVMTPWADPLMTLLEPYALAGTLPDEATAMQAYGLMAPMFTLFGVVCLAMLIPYMHRFRMANFCLLEDSRTGAMTALRASRRLMRGRFLQMLKLDLGLWPYYLGLGVMQLVLYSDLILMVLGVEVPVDATLLSTLVYVASALLLFLVQVTQRNRAEATYLCAYDALLEKPKTSGVVLGNIFDM